MSSPSTSFTFGGYTFDTPETIEGDPTHLRNGMYSADFRIITVDLDEKSISKGINLPVPKDEKYVEATTYYAQTLPVWNEDVMVKTSDGVPIIWFVKNGMTKWRSGPKAPKASLKAVCQSIEKSEPPMRHNEQDPGYNKKVQEWAKWQSGTEAAKTSLKVVYHLIDKFEPPKRYSGENSACKKKIQESTNFWKAKGCQYGTYLFQYYMSTCHSAEKGKLSADIDSVSPASRDAVQDYLRLTKWEHLVAAGWLEVLAPEVHERYNRRYSELREKVGPLDVGESGCFLTKNVTINAIDNPRKDNKEVSDGLVLSYPWHDFTGGDQIYLEVGMRFHQEAGDLLVAPSQYLTHMGLEIESGQRVGHTFSMKQRTYSPPKYQYFCDECDKAFTYNSGLLMHKKIDHPKDSQGMATEARRFYCHVAGCQKKGAKEGYSAPTTLRNHMNKDHPGVPVPRKFEDKMRPPTPHDVSPVIKTEIIDLTEA